MPPRKPQQPFQLALVLYDDCMPAGLFAAADLVRACNLRHGAEQIALTWVACSLDPVPTHGGPALKPQQRLAEYVGDAYLLPGMWLTTAAGLPVMLDRHAALLQALRALRRPAALWSYCVGVALAAETGWLDGRDASATWWLQDELSARYRRVRWNTGPAVCVDRNAVTAPGPNGHLPLVLDRLSHHFDAEVMRDVEEALMLPQPRVRHGAFHAVDGMTLRDPQLRRLLQFAQRTPAHELDLTIAAAALNVSVRTLCRLVQAGTGLSAGDWLRRVKLLQAGEALRHSDRPIKSISDQFGFSSPSYLHRAFKSATGLTPAAYRQTFASVLGFAPPPTA